MQDMSIRMVRSLGVGRFLQWGAMNARGASRGVVVFWDNRVLEMVGMEVGQFSISCHFKNTGFFHKMTNAHKRSNWLRNIKINEVWCIEENEIQEGVARAF